MDRGSRKVSGMKTSRNEGTVEGARHGVQKEGISPFVTGLKCRCPHCGKGALYQGLLRFASQCSVCNLCYSFEDIGDGASVFVMFAVGIFLVPLAIFFQLAFHPPFWLHILLWGPGLTLACIVLLRPVKAILLALQYKHKAEEMHLFSVDEG